jgi:hypothetical protein
MPRTKCIMVNNAEALRASTEQARIGTLQGLAPDWDPSLRNALCYGVVLEEKVIRLSGLQPHQPMSG